MDKGKGMVNKLLKVATQKKNVFSLFRQNKQGYTISKTPSPRYKLLFTFWCFQYYRGTKILS